VEEELVLHLHNDGQAPGESDEESRRKAASSGRCGDARRVALRSEVETPELQLWRDDAKGRRMLVKPLGNAIEFTPEGGSVTLRIGTEAATAKAVLSVTDTGEGIPRETFERIFEKFGQVEGRTAGRTTSTGLGLTFCKMAAEAHGGRI
jgi:signal transduction histidine kinase